MIREIDAPPTAGTQFIDPDMPSRSVHVEMGGTVVTRRVPPLVVRGSYLMSVGIELDPSEL